MNLTKKDKIEEVQKFVDHFGITFPILLDDTGDVSTMYEPPFNDHHFEQEWEVEHEIFGPLEEDDLDELIQPLIQS